MKTRMAIMAMALVVALGGIARADIITPVSGVTDNPGFGGPGAPHDVYKVHDGSGLDSTPPDVLNWTATGENNCWQEWGGSWGPIRLDLGASYDLTKAYIWNYQHSNGIYNGRQMNTFDIEVAADDITYTPAGSASLPLLDVTAPMPTYVANLAGASGVQYVKFLNMVSWGDTQSGLSEVRFEGVEAGAGGVIPEPAGLGLVGLALLGLRKRRS